VSTTARSALPVWEAVYAHERRAHRHRCRCCNKIVQAGARVLMYRQDNLTRVLHDACADCPFPGPGSEYTWRDTAVIVAMERLLRSPSASSALEVARWVIRQAGTNPVATRCDLSAERLVRYGASVEFALALGATLEQIHEAAQAGRRAE